MIRLRGLVLILYALLMLAVGYGLPDNSARGGFIAGILAMWILGLLVYVTAPRVER